MWRARCGIATAFIVCRREGGRWPAGRRKSIRTPFAWLISEHRMVDGLDTLLEGVLLGGVYALVAVGLSLIFGIIRLVNLAHGDIVVLAAYLILTAMTVAGVSLGVATVLTVIP